MNIPSFILDMIIAETEQSVSDLVGNATPTIVKVSNESFSKVWENRKLEATSTKNDKLVKLSENILKALDTCNELNLYMWPKFKLTILVSEQSEIGIIISSK